MGKDKKVDNSVRILTGSTKDVPVRMTKYGYYDLGMMMLNYIFELARMVDANTKLALSFEQVIIPEEHNISYKFSEDVKIKLIDAIDTECPVCHRAFPDNKAVFVKISNMIDGCPFKINLSLLAHMVNQHNVLLPMDLMFDMLSHFNENVRVVRPMTEWSKDELIAEIAALNTKLAAATAPTYLAPPITAKKDDVIATADTTDAMPKLNLPVAPNGEDEVEVDDDSDDAEEDIVEPAASDESDDDAEEADDED
jgi:hypothetical protein